jgi:hypothetical protein
MGFSYRESSASGTRKAEGACGSGGASEEGSEKGAVSDPAPRTTARPGDLYGVDYTATWQCNQRGGGVGRPARSDADRIQGHRHSGTGGVEPGVVGRFGLDRSGRGIIQITPQMRILVAIEAVDGRKYAPSINMRSC